MNKRIVKIILVEPKGSINLGSVARLCENFGVSELRLVSPRCDPSSPEARRMASKGLKILEKANQYSSLLEAIEDCPIVIATCGRKDHGEIPLQKSNETFSWLIQTKKETPIAIVFGREDRGLTNQELLMANKAMTIETSDRYPSLNLSHAVAIVLHELNNYFLKGSKKKLINVSNPASAKQLNDFSDDAERLLLEIGFLLRHTASSRMKKLKAILIRAEAKPEEVSLIRGILHQVRWAINNNINQI
tara:strand:+ start:14354 stop:15094 length:741 start_codon:yes stop_codon:yes gene_type:complete